MPTLKQPAIDINLVISEQPQSGKTTFSLKTMLTTHKEGDNFFYTFDRKNVHEDAVLKYEELAKEFRSTKKLITNPKDLDSVYKDRLHNNYYPVDCIFLGNISAFKNSKKLYCQSNTAGFQQIAFFDEIHRYLVGENTVDSSTVQIDNFVNEAIDNNQLNSVYMISATPTDLLYSDYDFKKVHSITPYPGFKGFNHVEWYTKASQEDFNVLVDTYKKEGVIVLTENLKRFFSIHGDRNLLVNIYHLKGFQEALAAELGSSYGIYNSDQKATATNLTGRYSMGVSQTFAQNKIIYNPGSNIVTDYQAVGRTYTKDAYPLIATTNEMKAELEAYYKFMVAIIDNDVFKLPVEERHKWAEEYQHLNPKRIPGSTKHKKQRITVSRKTALPGNKNNTNSSLYYVYNKELYEETWKGDGWGENALKILAEQNPEAYKEHLDAGNTHETDTENEKEGSRWRKMDTRAARTKVAKDPSRPGYITIVIKGENWSIEDDYYLQDRTVVSNQVENTGNVKKKLKYL